MKTEGLVKFSDLPISARTLSGLESAGFVNMTEIQRQSIPHCLRGSDVQVRVVFLFEKLSRKSISGGQGFCERHYYQS